MPMLTVYTGDPAIGMRCNEIRTFQIVPNRILGFADSLSYRIYEAVYHRLWWYGLKGGHGWYQKGICLNNHYMTELIGYTAYFLNSK